MKHFNSFWPELHQNALSFLLGVSPAASSAFSGTIHSRKSIKAFNQILVSHPVEDDLLVKAVTDAGYDVVKIK